MVETVVLEGAREKVRWAPIKANGRSKNIVRELENMPNFNVKIATKSGVDTLQSLRPKY